MKKDNKSHIFKHLHAIATCFDSYNSSYFKIIDKAIFKFDLNIKEALHINQRKPNLNAQQNHLALTLSLQFLSPIFHFCLCFVVVFAFLFYPLFSLSLILIIGIFYCLNYTLLFLHLITNTSYHIFLFHLFFFIISTLIIGIFYCLNYISLLLYLIITYLVIEFYNNYVINICPRQLL